MPVPYIFANQSGNVPASQIDADFAYILANTVQVNSPNVFTALQSMSGAAFNEAKGADVPSASTLNLDSVTGNYVTVSGTNTITAVTLTSGAMRMIRATGAFTWTNNAAVVVTGGANWVATSGDIFLVRGDAAGVVYVIPFPATAAGQRALAGLGTISTQNANAVAITGGAVDGTTVGSTTRAAGAFTTLSANAAASLTSTLAVTGIATLSASYAGGVQSLTGAGALNVTTMTTAWTTTGAQAGTLADGVQGQVKHVVMVADGGDGTLTPANFGNGTTITFNDVGDAVILQFLGSDWWLLSNVGCTIA